MMLKLLIIALLPFLTYGTGDSTWTMEVICKDDTQTLSCPSGEALYIEKACCGHEKGPASACSHQHLHHASMDDLNCHVDNNIDEVQSTCNGENSCVVAADRSLLESGCQGPKRSLEILYTCESDEVETTTAASFDPECLDAGGNPVSGDPFEKPGDCGNFYQCSSGILNTLPCSMGTAFNPVSGSCDDPMNVPGCTILK